uniref:Uncharacterized protein n=1 Tax=Arundo donax TaxID=35708 RepID=A0A0A9AFG6_ARUDO
MWTCKKTMKQIWQTGASVHHYLSSLFFCYLFNRE